MKHCHDFDRHTEYEFFLSTLSENGNRITEQRKKLIQAILSFKSPFSAEEIFDVTQIDLSTIYRSLATFEQMKLLQTIDFAEGGLRYEYHGSSQEHHHHVICRKCKKVDALDVCQLKPLEAAVAKMGYSEISHKLEFFGLCKDCCQSV